MSKHLSDDVLADLADTGASHPHLAACDRCRLLVQDARDALAQARRVSVPEPSPLFWDHLSARVRDGLRDEGRSTGKARRYLAWLPSTSGAGTLRAWAARLPVAAAVLLVCAVAVWLVPRGRRADTAPPTATASRPTASQVAEVQAAGGEMLPPSNDPSWGVIAHVVDSVRLEDPVLVRPGATDRAVAHLSVEEQQEFMRLLKSELSAPPSQ